MSGNDHASRIAEQLAMAEEESERDTETVTPGEMTVTGDRVPEKLGGIVGEDELTVRTLVIAGSGERIRVSASGGHLQVEHVDGGESA